jgi:HSP20 family protein
MRQMLDWEPFRGSPILPSPAAAFLPPFDVKETDEGYFFTADLPGVQEKDLDISITGPHLTVSGRRDPEQPRGGTAWYSRERPAGMFRRTFTLPNGAQSDHIEAELRNGILTVHVPKSPESQPKKIAVKVSSSFTDKVKGIFENKETSAQA